MKKLLLISTIAIALGGCYNDKFDKLYPTPATTVDLCDTAVNPATYATTVVPIMNQSCAIAGCHDANTGAGGYDLTQYSHVKVAATSGLLLSDINSGKMPENLPKLSDCKIKQITYWVNHGALEN